MQTSRTRRITATERFHREAKRRRMSPVAVIFGLIGAGMIMAVVAILFGGGEREEAFRARFEHDLMRAAKKESDGDFKGALALYRELLERIRDRPDCRVQAAELRARIARLQRQMADEEAARAELRGYLTRARKATPETAASLLEEGRKLLHAYARAPLPMLADVKKETVRLEKLVPKPPPSPTEFRAEVEAKCSVSKRTGNFAEALRLWDGYLARTKKPEWTSRATLYRDAVNRMARETAQAIRRKAERLGESGDAETLLKKERPRFEGTEGMEFLR